MKSGKNNKVLKLIGATAVSLFSLLSVFVATMAWFAMNTKTDGSGLNVGVVQGSDIQILSCYAVRYDGNYGAIAYDVSAGKAEITMSEYDYIFTDRNVNTPLFLRMEVTNFKTDGDLVVTIPCSGSYKTDNKVDPYLSNVISAKFLYGLDRGNGLEVDNYTWSGDSAHTAAVVSSYQGMLAHAADLVGTPFVHNGTKDDSITLTLPAASVFSNDFIIQKDDGAGHTIDVAVVYVELDYHVTNTVNLVTEYLTSYNETEHSVAFSSDIDIITLINEGNE